tara:strand:+ start:2050 stop:2550 length:501 start_codon:yes stop_codon:yes gene_type:complete
MNILTVDNVTYDLNAVPNEIDDLQYCVLDCGNPKLLDYFFIPLIFLESFNAPAVILDIGGQTIEMPMDWSILIGEKEMGICEMVPLTSLNDRGFEAFVHNPFSGYTHEFKEVKIVNVFQEVKWYFPKLKNGHILTMPLRAGSEPSCVFFAKELNQIPDQIQVGDLI